MTVCPANIPKSLKESAHHMVFISLWVIGLIRINIYIYNFSVHMIEIHLTNMLSLFLSFNSHEILRAENLNS